MRYVWLVLLSWVVGTTVLAQSFSPRWLNTNVETMRFRQGVSPTAGYTGAVDSWLNSAAATTNYGGDSTMVFDPTSTPILNFDISALPDDAIITAARLRLYMATEGSAQGDGNNAVSVYRIAKPWTESHVTFNARKDPVADSLWGTAGALDVSASVAVFGDAARIVSFPWNTAISTWANRGTEGGTMLSWGLDSLYSSHGLSGTDGFDAHVVDFGTLMDSDVVTTPDAPRWIEVDVSKWARMVHVGAWAPYGFYIQDQLIQGHTALTFATSEDGTALHRPELVIDYIWAVEDEPSSSGGGGQGASTLGFEPLK